MKGSLGWLFFTFVTTTCSLFLFDWSITMGLFINGLLMSIHALINEHLT